jgi:hypothetical protein
MGTNPSTKIQMNLVARCMVEVKSKEGFRLIHVWRAKVGFEIDVKFISCRLNIPKTILHIF